MIIRAYTPEKYHDVDFESYEADPAPYNKMADMFNQECLPVGINDTYMPIEKDGADNLEKAQYNIKERFGYLTPDDRGSNESY